MNLTGLPRSNLVGNVGARAIPTGAARRLEVRVEASNVTNTPKYGNPVNNLQNANFGRILGTLGLPYAERQVRLGLRLSF